jgi:hypothetical protein
MQLLIGDDWAQDHHDIEVMGEGGNVLARRRCRRERPRSAAT